MAIKINVYDSFRTPDIQKCYVPIYIQLIFMNHSYTYICSYVMNINRLIRWIDMS